MATRESVGNCIRKCEEAMEYAREQFKEGNLQGNYNSFDYTEALRKLEQSYNELEKLKLSANAQQREELDRARLELQQLQNQIILQDTETFTY
ncbi:YtzC family protein [Heyndrickxia ginsengihumi]|uniref:YtzC family protein n=1 Tax=Heyndrickxia ginsengihumi TaxID=363870 RepID=A0A0A6VED9_9BACI|nr:YtzC family protein [Heyndrickxia ginsengihumi]KHD85946.1 hypothetical protein NG54_06120 [Heyndrickxia ginsengihumi]MBE6183893.1 DUF2524 family protein [Bacillus sp. (in: firmicutes)]MCM3022087.1 YtzC family protein [Heyndrickxia ginsengihumi]NEY21006.1 YtzC family protein [Heyndrickxia ginsengihumi]